mmetsp:Transcript_14485/g.43523  ORF Transcript_14485/g.43523 Transcript_14485/m.43523 type:complete len:322 (-) Transcript_14485:191-1156(-)
MRLCLSLCLCRLPPLCRLLFLPCLGLRLCLSLSPSLFHGHSLLDLIQPLSQAIHCHGGLASLRLHAAEHEPAIASFGVQFAPQQEAALSALLVERSAQLAQLDATLGQLACTALRLARPLIQQLPGALALAQLALARSQLLAGGAQQQSALGEEHPFGSQLCLQTALAALQSCHVARPIPLAHIAPPRSPAPGQRLHAHDGRQPSALLVEPSSQTHGQRHPPAGLCAHHRRTLRPVAAILHRAAAAGLCADHCAAQAHELAPPECAAPHTLQEESRPGAIPLLRAHQPAAAERLQTKQRRPEAQVAPALATAARSGLHAHQ